MISIHDLSKVYGIGIDRIEVLKNVSLEVKEGEIFGVIGRSGAGKSTLMHCINMLERPNTGTIIVNRLNLSVMGERELRLARRHMGMIFQHFNLLTSRTA